VTTSVSGEAMTDDGEQPEESMTDKWLKANWRNVPEAQKMIKSWQAETDKAQAMEVENDKLRRTIVGLTNKAQALEAETDKLHLRIRDLQQEKIELQETINGICTWSLCACYDGMRSQGHAAANADAKYEQAKEEALAKRWRRHAKTKFLEELSHTEWMKYKEECPKTFTDDDICEYAWRMDCDRKNAKEDGPHAKEVDKDEKAKAEALDADKSEKEKAPDVKEDRPDAKDVGKDEEAEAEALDANHEKAPDVKEGGPDAKDVDKEAMKEVLDAEKKPADRKDEPAANAPPGLQLLEAKDDYAWQEDMPANMYDWPEDATMTLERPC